MDKKFVLFALLAVALVSKAENADTVTDGLRVPEREIPARVYFEDGKLHFASRDNKFKLWFDNRVYVDAACYSPSVDIDGLSSKPNKDLEADDGQFRFSNGISIRRARFGIKSTLFDHWFAELDLDFAYNEVEIKDMFLGYSFNDNWSVKVGNFKEPMSMERMTSSKYLNMLERPMAVEAFAAGRRLGAAFTGWGNRWWVSAGVFGRGVDIIQKEKNRGDDGWGVTARAAFTPVNTPDFTIHVGGYGAFRKPDMTGTEDRIVEMRTFPEGRVDRRRFIRAEIDNVRHYTTWGLEFGVRYQKALFHGEYIYTRMARYKVDGDIRLNIKDCDFNGWYVAGSYMILGEQRRYAPADAEFGPMEVNRKGGNFEIAARVSYINLNDFHDPTAVITGGKGYNYTTALNWYPVRNVLVGFNYVYVNNDKYADDKGHLTVAGKPLSQAMPGGVDFSIFQMRFMISF